MAFTFKSAGHLFATFFQKAGKVITDIEGTKATVETVTAAVPGSTGIVGIENVAYAVLGEIASVLNAGGAAAADKLSNAGLDIAVVQSVQSLVAGASQIGSLATAVAQHQSTITPTA